MRLNVQAKDRAVVVHTLYPENKNKVCTVVQRVPAMETKYGGVWWFVTFDEPVMTRLGLQPFTVLRDKDLTLFTKSINVVRRPLVVPGVKKTKTARTIADIPVLEAVSA